MRIQQFLSRQDVIFGLLLYAAAMFMIVVMNSFAKLASGEHHPIEVVFYRNLVALGLILPFVGIRNEWHKLKTARPKAQIFRALIGTLSVILVFHTYKYLPIADATTMLYAAPLIVTALSVPILKEPVGLLRWLAVLIGFSGVFLIAQPSGDAEPVGYVFGLAASFTIALVSIFLRDLGKSEEAITTVFYFILIGTIITGAFMPFIGSLPTKEIAGILIIVGIAGTAQQFLKTRAFTMAPAATLIPLQFTGLVWAVFFGLVLFGDWPSLNVWAGAFIVIGANLFILWREKKRQHS